MIVSDMRMCVHKMGGYVQTTAGSMMSLQLALLRLSAERDACASAVRSARISSSSLSAACAAISRLSVKCAACASSVRGAKISSSRLSAACAACASASSGARDSASQLIADASASSKLRTVTGLSNVPITLRCSTIRIAAVSLVLPKMAGDALAAFVEVVALILSLSVFAAACGATHWPMCRLLRRLPRRCLPTPWLPRRVMPVSALSVAATCGATFWPRYRLLRLLPRRCLPSP